MQVRDKQYTCSTSATQANMVAMLYLPYSPLYLPYISPVSPLFSLTARLHMRAGVANMVAMADTRGATMYALLEYCGGGSLRRLIGGPT